MRKAAFLKTSGPLGAEQAETGKWESNPRRVILKSLTCILIGAEPPKLGKLTTTFYQ